MKGVPLNLTSVAETCESEKPITTDLPHKYVNLILVVFAVGRR